MRRVGVEEGPVVVVVEATEVLEVMLEVEEILEVEEAREESLYNSNLFPAPQY